MPRVLTATRAEVRPEQEPAYLAALGQLARRLRARGESLWLFRHSESPGTFLEFSESAERRQHRTQRELDTEEALLEARLRTLAAYAPESPVLWEEVPLDTE